MLNSLVLLRLKSLICNLDFEAFCSFRRIKEKDAVVFSFELRSRVYRSAKSLGLGSMCAEDSFGIAFIFF